MNIGDKIPDFTLLTDEGKTFNSSELLGKPAVVYFYPKDETKGCTAQACAFRDSFEDFTEAGARVVGISSDDVQSHANFKKHHRLPFTLLADTEKKVRNKFGVKGNLLGLIPGRETFIFNEESVLVHKFESQVNIDKHISESLKILKGGKPK
ncbi:redoxin domain-containing protein [bacterium]|nr:redoxin domain-containing protein [bacterium]